MEFVWISVLRIPEPGTQCDSECVANYSFEGETWMDSLDKAYAWLREHREERFTYHVWA